MGLDTFKSKVEQWLGKKEQNRQEAAELSDFSSKHREIYDAHSNLDDSIRSEMEHFQGNLDEKSETFHEELEMIREERERLYEGIQAELAKLQETHDRLSRSIDENRYASPLTDAVKACANCMKGYNDLLAMMDEANAQDHNSMTLAESYQKECAVGAELMIREQAINMLVSLSPRQRASVRYYTANGYSSMNSILRGQQTVYTQQEKEDILELHNLLRQHRTSVPVTLYRGVSSDVHMMNKSGRGLNEIPDEELIGKLLSDKAFVSTSLREEDAFNKSTILVLDAPAGTSGVYVGDISSMAHYESEFLMDCGQIFRVTKVERRSEKRYIYAKVIPRSI